MLVFTHGFVERPASTAFFASRPAQTRTLGFDVFVQLVIAAMTTAPSAIFSLPDGPYVTVLLPAIGESASLPSGSNVAACATFASRLSASCANWSQNESLADFNETRSCG